MATTIDSRPLSYYLLPTPPDSSSSIQTAFLLPPLRPRTPVTSHYRPFSYCTPPPSAEPSPVKPKFNSMRLSNSPSIQALSTIAFGRSKEKSKWKEKPHGGGSETRPRSQSNSNGSVPRPPIFQSQTISTSKPKKRRSFANLLSMASDATFIPPVPPTLKLSTDSTMRPHFAQVVAPPGADEHDSDDSPEEEEEDTSYVFHAKDKWLTRHGMTLHPYREEVPYMQAYDPILLENDRQADLLLRALNPSPAFRDYKDTPPHAVLDLGCGEGHWALYAAKTWQQSHVTAFDVVDILMPEVKAQENITFVRGNFVEYDLPFPDSSFEFVRMANLTLCIPYEKWELVFSEVQRILSPTGRLELIDDQLFFPYGVEPITKPTPTRSHAGNEPDIDSDGDSESDDSAYYSPAHTLIGSDESSSSSPDKKSVRLPAPQSSEMEEVTPTAETPVPDTPRPQVQDDQDDYLALPLHIPNVPWSERKDKSRQMEMLFEQMMHEKYEMHTRPSEFVLDLMKQTFGTQNAGKVESYHLKLAPPEMGPSHESPDYESEEGLKGLLYWKERRDRVEKPGGVMATVPEGISAKAAGRLGISYSTLVDASAQATKPRTSTSSSSINSTSTSSSVTQSIKSTKSTHRSKASSDWQQSPGLIHWPSTFLPMDPLELEMHACRHLHTLLGCKAALSDYVQSFLDDDGVPYVDQPSFDDDIFEYECFRRERLNWPNVPEISLEARHVLADVEDHPAKLNRSTYRTSTDSSSSSVRSSLSSTSNEELTHVRTIRVFEAFKSRRFARILMEGRQ